MEDFPRTYVFGDPPEDPERHARSNIEPEKFEDRIIFMSMLNDIEWTQRGYSETCVSNPNKSRLTGRDSREDIGHSSALETKRNGMELSVIQYSRASVL